MMAAHRLPDDRLPVLLSAHEPDLIGQDAAAILNYLEHHRGAEGVTAAVASTLLSTRRVRRHRAVIRAAERTELEAGLRALAGGEPHRLVARSSENSAPRTAFLFPGQGNQWPSMGAEAYRRLPVYRAEAQRCAQAFAAAGLPSPLAYLLADSDSDSDSGRDSGRDAGRDSGREWSQIHIQGAQFTHAASLAQLWRCCGVLPDITVGHSLGEVAAAYVAGALALPDAVAVVAARATVVGRLPGRYGMAVLGVGAERAGQLIAETPGWLEVSVVNSPSSSVVSGDRDAVAGIVGVAEQNRVFVRELDVDFPAHTSKLESLRATFADLLPTSAFLDAPVEFASSARGGVVRADTDFADYWYQNLRNTVRFDHAVATAAQRGAGTFVEMSADPSLLYALGELVQDAVLLTSGRRDEPFVEHVSASIVAAAVANPGYRWSDLADVGDRQPLWGFPSAPMRAVRLWATPEPLPPVPGLVPAVFGEEWQPLAVGDVNPADRPSCGVTIVAPVNSDAGDPVVRQLTDAVTTHDGCYLTDPDEAEIAVLVAPPLMAPDAVSATQQFASAARQLDYRRAVGQRCRRVWLVTTCGERMDSDAPAALPGQAALAAMHRSVGFEFPEQTFAHLDLPSRSIDADTAQACVDALLGDQTEVAWRDGCLVRTLQECAEPPAERVLDAAALDDVVITGGSGTIGLRYARHCVEAGARRVILLSRNGLSQDDLNRLTHGYPAQVHAPACDITDADAVSMVAEQFGGAGAALLIHTAGTARFAPHDQLGEQDLADVFSAKVIGLVQMTEIWPLRPEARILLCSSVSGVWGGHGHGAYAASNRILDVLAADLRAQGLDAMAVRWGLWQGTTIADADEIARIERSGLIAMEPDAAVTASLRRYGGDPLILAADLDRLRVFFESQGVAVPFTVPVAEADDVSPAHSQSTDQRSVSDLVRAEIAAAFSLDGPKSVDLSAALVDLGADSMLALDLRDRLRRWTGQSVPAARLLGGITGTELIDLLQSAAEQPAPNPENTAKPERLERVESSRD